MRRTPTEGNEGNEEWRSELGDPYKSRGLDEIAARWDAKAASWDEELGRPSCHLNEDEAYSRFVRAAQGLIAERRDFCARHGMIDAGCGTGLVLSAIISSFAWGVGVDISSEMIARARAKNIPKANFTVGDCFQMPRLCPRAGAVFSRGVLLSHYGGQAGEALLRAAHDSLVPGGFAVVDFLNEAGRTKAVHAPENKEYFTRTAAEALARRAGFERVIVLGRNERRVLLVFGERACDEEASR